jgi:hypothetical protein
MSLDFIWYWWLRMTEKELLLKEKLSHKGLFDFSALYAFAHSWFKDEDYGVDEERYEEKVSGSSRNLLIEWKATKPLSDYFKIEHKVKFEIEGMTDVEVEVDGEKKSMNKGSIKLDIKSAMVIDPESKWDVKPYYRFLRDVYNKYIIRGRVENIKDKIGNDARGFKESLKQFLDLMGRR